ncbi:MAG TPA: oligosaccharide flippase family protein [Trichocoleus sp.]|jgi:O-antigen/teichoic acid export membrane protein
MASSTNSIKKLAIRGAVWTVAGYGAGQILRFGSNLLLTRLLFPDLFGLMSLVYVFISGLLLFSDLGIGTSVIQNKRGDDPDFLNTAWTMQVIRGAILWLLCLLIAVPVAHLYNEPQLAWLLPVVGLNSVAMGLNSTAIFTLNRNLSVKQLAIFELGGQLISVIVMLTWAVISPSIWALVAGGLVAPLFQLVWSHQMNKGKPNRFTWDKSAVSEIVSFGKWIFLSTALTFLSTQSDRLILGKLFSFEMLGVYGVAFTLADIPRQLMMAVSHKVIFPTYAKMLELPRSEFRTKILRNRRMILLVLAVVVAALTSCGDLVVTTLYDGRYRAAAWMLPLLAMGTWPVMLTQTIDPILFAIGQPRYIAFGCFLSFLFYIVGIPVTFSLYGSVGAVISVALSNIPPWLIVTYALGREKISVIRQDITMTLIFLATVGLLTLFRSLLGIGFPSFG